MKKKKPKSSKGNIALLIESKFTEDTKQVCRIESAICSLNLVISRPILTKLLKNQKLNEKSLTTTITEMLIEKIRHTKFQILDSELLSAQDFL